MSEIFQTFIHRITVFTNYIAIQYAFCENLPIPETPVIMRGSNKSKMVHQKKLMRTLMLYISFQATSRVSWLHKLHVKRTFSKQSGAFFFYSSINGIVFYG